MFGRVCVRLYVYVCVCVVQEIDEGAVSRGFEEKLEAPKKRPELPDAGNDNNPDLGLSYRYPRGIAARSDPFASRSFPYLRPEGFLAVIWTNLFAPRVTRSSP